MSDGGLPLTNRRADGSQALALVFCAVLGRSLVTVPPMVIERTGSSAPLATLVALPLVFLHLWLVLALARRFPARSLFQYLPAIAGAWPGRLLGLVFLLYLGVVPSMGIRYYGEAVGVYLLEMTPQPVIGLLFLATAAALAYLGLESMLRFFQVIMFFELLILVPLLLLAAPNFRWTFLQPVLPLDWPSFLQGVGAAVQLFGGAELLLVFYPYFNQQPVVGRYAARALLLAHLLTLWATAGVLASFGPAATGRYLFPSVEFVRAVRVPSTLLEQPSSIFSAFWVIAVIKIISLYLLALALGVKQLLGLKNYRPALLALLPPLLVVSQLPPTPQAVLAFTSHSAPLRLATMWGLPLVFLLLALWRGKKG